MKDTDRDKRGAPARPAWVDEQAEDVIDSGRPRRERLPRQPVPGKHEDDGLWEHVLVIGGIAVLVTFLAAHLIPRTVPLWEITAFAAAVTAVTAYVTLTLTGSGAVAAYLAAWGIVLTSWITTARIRGPWDGQVIFALLLAAAVLAPAGVTVIRRHRDRVKRAAMTGRDNAATRECRHWEDLLTRLEAPGVSVRDVIHVDGGYQVHCQLGKFAVGSRTATIETIRGLPGRLAQHKRALKGAVYIQEDPPGGTSADFIIHVTERRGPRLARYLPAENDLLSITRDFGLGVLDTGREFTLKLRERVVFICGVRGSGKSTLENVFIAQLARMPDACIFMIDLKGGQEARAWLMPWIMGWTDTPVIHWLATTREEARIMLDALWEAGKARAESGKYAKKLRPRPDAPAIIVICDETAVMTGHQLREDGLSNTQLATRLLQIAETFRSVAIDPVVAAVRAVVDVTGNSGIKAMAEVKIGMRVGTMMEGQAIFPDNIAAAKQLAQLSDRGMGIPKVGAELYPPVHFYNITDGEPDDDGNPTEDRITPIALSCADRRPEPEQFVQDAMNKVRVTAGDQERGAYEARWELPYIKGLLENWKTEAGVQDPPEPIWQPADSTPGMASEDAFDDMVRNDPLLRDLGGSPDLDDGSPGRPMNPVRKRMYELLIERGNQGYQAGVLQVMLENAGLGVSRQTVHAWLAQAEKQGYVYRIGKPQSGRSRWIWRLRAGDEFDIPGWTQAG